MSHSHAVTPVLFMVAAHCILPSAGSDATFCGCRSLRQHGILQRCMLLWRVHLRRQHGYSPVLCVRAASSPTVSAWQLRVAASGRRLLTIPSRLTAWFNRLHVRSQNFGGRSLDGMLPRRPIWNWRLLQQHVLSRSDRPLRRQRQLKFPGRHRLLCAYFASPALLGLSVGFDTAVVQGLTIRTLSAQLRRSTDCVTLCNAQATYIANGCEHTDTVRMPALAGPLGSSSFCNGACCKGVCGTNPTTNASVCCAFQETNLSFLQRTPIFLGYLNVYQFGQSRG